MQRNKWICGLLVLMMFLQICTCAYAGERYVWGAQGSVAYFEENGLIGLLDMQGNVLIEPQFTEVTHFYYELARVHKGELRGIITKAGDILVEPADYEYLSYGSYGQNEAEEVLAYKEVQGQWGIITLTGEKIPETQWNAPVVFRGGIDIVEKDGEYNLLNSSGELVLEQWWPAIELPILEYGISPFERLDVQDEQGRPLFSVQQRNLDENDSQQWKYGVVNVRGEWIVPCEWDWIRVTGNTLFLVRKEEKWGAFDYAGNMVIPVEWDDLRDANEGLLWAVKDEKKGYVNLRGETVLPLEWDTAFPFEHGLAVVKKGKQQGIIDPTGAFVIPMQTRYNFTDINKEGYIIYERGGTWGFMDRDGKVLSRTNNITDGWFGGIEGRTLNDGFCVVGTKADKWNFMDVNGNMLFPKFQGNVVAFRHGLAFVGTTMEMYLIDTTGEPVSEVLWRAAHPFVKYGDQLIARVWYQTENGSQEGWINERGEPIHGIKLPKAEQEQ